MQKTVLVAFAAAFVMLASGCMSASPKATVSPTMDSLVPEAGRVDGVVTDDELRPIDNASVTLVEDGRSALSSSDGTFEFPDVPPGTYTLSAGHPEFGPAEKTLVVLADLDARVNVTLIKLPKFAPRNFTEHFDGKYECAMETLIIPGSCGILIENITCGYTPQYYCGDPFGSKYDFPIMVEPHWDSLVVELKWSQGALGLDGLRLYLENANVTGKGGHGIKVARVDSGEPVLRIRIDRGIESPSAEYYTGTKVKAYIPDDGGKELVRVFPMGMLWDETRMVCNDPYLGGCLLGVGAGLNVAFTVYVTQFVNGPAPAVFSAVPK